MAFQQISIEDYQADEEYQLGSPIGQYERYVTLSGKVALAGVLLEIFFIVVDVIIMVRWGGFATPFFEATLGFGQGLFGVGSLMSAIRHENLITPLHPKLSISVYKEGLIYRKGRKIQVVRWEEIRSIRRQFTVQRRKGKIKYIRPAYICDLDQKPELVLDASITDVIEIGVFIEREITGRLLPQLLADYQSDEYIDFAQLALNQEAIEYAEYQTQKIDWSHVSKIEFEPDKLVVTAENDDSDPLTAPLTSVPNLCLLEALLEHIRQEKGFTLSLSAATTIHDAPAIQTLNELKRRPHYKKTTRFSTVVITLLVILGLGLEMLYLRMVLTEERLDEIPNQTFQVTSTPTVIINADTVDSIIVLDKQGDTNQVLVSGFNKANGLNVPSDIQENATQSDNTINLAWTMKPIIFLGIGYEKIDLFVQMPANGNVQIVTYTGVIAIRYITGEINVKTLSGQIDVSATVQGHSQLQSTSGEIDYCGSLDLQSTDLFQSKSGKINIELPADAAFNLHSLGDLNNDFGGNTIGTTPRAHLDVTTNTGVITIHNGGSQLVDC